MKDFIEAQVTQASEDLARQIDFEILKDVLVKSCGWHYIEFDRLLSREHSVDLVNWAHTECRGNWKHSGRHWLFEQEDDAIMFKLTWS